MGETPEVVDIAIDRATAITVAWSDGFVATIPLGELRQACPCATCRGAREQGRVVAANTSPTVIDAELVGAWGLSVRWDDGHDTGIYPWDSLRQWAADSAR